MEPLRVIGLMSGTSLDGVDAAWIETDGVSVKSFGPSLTMPYDAGLRADLRTLLEQAPGLNPTDPVVVEVSRKVTDAHLAAIRALGVEADLIGLHGQTILHRPDQRRTWQLGDAAAMAHATGLRVAHDFRGADVAAGGEGAPFAPAYHAALAATLTRPLAVLNLGGVGNITFIGADGELLALDTGPGNGPLDDWVSRHTGQLFDPGGRLAASGRADPETLAQLMADPYFARPAPKSLDRLDFARSIAASGLDRLSVADGAATLVAFTAEAVARAPLPSPPLRWLVTGGGRHNASLMAALRARLDAPVEPVEVVGWDGDALEAQCFGFLAARVVAGLPLSYPGTTGVPHPMLGGAITIP